MKRFINILLHYSICLLIVLCIQGCGSGSADESHDAEHHEHSHDEEAEIELSEKQMNTVDIRLGTFTKKEIGSGIRANGVLAVNPQDIAEISPLMAGQITKILVTEGETVAKGAVVAQIENLDILTFTQDYALASEELQLALSELDRQQKLADAGAGVKKNLDQARSAVKLVQTRLATLERLLLQAGIKPGDNTSTAAVKSPVGGIVSKISAITGGYADLSTSIMTVTDNSKIFAELNVYEKDLPKVEKNAKVDIFLTNTGESLSGTIKDINRTIDAETKAIHVKVVLDNPDLSLIPGMAVTAYINSGAAEVDALPEDAVVTSGGKSYIYILAATEEEHGQTMFRFEPVEVVTGNRAQGFVEITPVGEIEPDAKIVVSKAFYIASMAADHGEHNH